MVTVYVGSNSIHVYALEKVLVDDPPEGPPDKKKDSEEEKDEQEQVNKQKTFCM